MTRNKNMLQSTCQNTRLNLLYRIRNKGVMIGSEKTDYAQRAGLIFTEVTTHKSVVWGLVWSVAITEICQD